MRKNRIKFNTFTKRGNKIVQAQEGCLRGNNRLLKKKIEVKKDRLLKKKIEVKKENILYIYCYSHALTMERDSSNEMERTININLATCCRFQ